MLYLLNIPPGSISLDHVATCDQKSSMANPTMSRVLVVSNQQSHSTKARATSTHISLFDQNQCHSSGNHSLK